MRDLIDRAAAIDALEEPCKVSDTWTDEYAVGERMQWEKDVKALNSLTSAQPEVIRCKDCEFSEKSKIFKGYYACSIMGKNMKSNDFCSYAERRTDENNNSI